MPQVMMRDLAWLVELGELGHVTDAAAALGTSQPTLSRALARLEAELGVRIFERVPTGVEPTPDGELVLEAARELVYGMPYSEWKDKYQKETSKEKIAQFAANKKD